jgi:hypothetical protein
MGGCVGHMSRRAHCARRCGREAEGGGLLNRYRVVKLYRGFESLRLRQLIVEAIDFLALPSCEPHHVSCPWRLNPVRHPRRSISRFAVSPLAPQRSGRSTVSAPNRAVACLYRGLNKACLFQIEAPKGEEIHKGFGASMVSLFGCYHTLCVIDAARSTSPFPLQTCAIVLT